jgi:hypothetical protein
VTAVAQSSPVADAAVALVAAIANPSGGMIHAGDGKAPDGAAGRPPLAFFPYAIVYVGTDLVDGSIAEPKIDGVHRVQVKCVGRDRRGASWLRDQVVERLCTRSSWTIDGHKVKNTEVLSAPPVFFDDDDGGRFAADVLVSVHVVPLVGS